MTVSIDEIRAKMQDKPTDELLAIWTANDRLGYAAISFDAIAAVLQARGVELPPQRALVNSQPVFDSSRAGLKEALIEAVRTGKKTGDYKWGSFIIYSVGPPPDCKVYHGWIAWKAGIMVFLAFMALMFLWIIIRFGCPSGK